MGMGIVATVTAAGFIRHIGLMGGVIVDGIATKSSWALVAWKNLFQAPKSFLF
jgi:hypothetical protein